jgi:hypothetical protein
MTLTGPHLLNPLAAPLKTFSAPMPLSRKDDGEKYRERHNFKLSPNLK